MSAEAALGEANVLMGLILVGALAALCVLAIAFFGGQEAKQRRIRRRVNHIQDRWMRAGDDETVAHIRRNLSDSSFRSLDRLIKRILPPPAQFRQHLARTGRRITMGEYVLANLLVGAVVAGAAIYGFGAPHALGLFLGIIIGVGVPYLAIGRMATRRMNRFLKLFPDAIDLIVRGLKSGLPVGESIAVVGHEIAEPVGSEFRRISDNMKIGQPLEEALWEAAARIPLADFRFFVISLSVQRETGGNLTETLENLTNIVRRRQQMKLKIRAMSSEARASAYIIGSLPFILGTIIYLMNPEYASMLYTDPRGRFLVGIGLTWLVIGAAVMAKMVRFEI
jgi:tight adherence protein B